MVLQDRQVVQRLDCLQQNPLNIAKSFVDIVNDQ
jgi:hypothetical protein